MHTHDRLTCAFEQPLHEIERIQHNCAEIQTANDRLKLTTRRLPQQLQDHIGTRVQYVLPSCIQISCIPLRAPAVRPWIGCQSGSVDLDAIGLHLHPTLVVDIPSPAAIELGASERVQTSRVRWEYAIPSCPMLYSRP